MTNTTIPSRNPAKNGTLGGLLQLAFRKSLESTDGQLPCKVISYNRTTNKAVVQPLINIVTTDGAQHDHGQYLNVPVLALGGGGFCVTFPLVAGDLGWIEASDRDISLFVQSVKKGMASAKPNTFRIHSFEDGRFIPDAFTQYTHSSEDNANMIIQSYGGTVKIALGTGLININADTVTVNSKNAVVNATVDAKINTATAEVNATTSATITTPQLILACATSIVATTAQFLINGALTVSGLFSFGAGMTSTGGGTANMGSSDITTTGSITSNGKVLATHTHPVTTAPGTTGSPT